MMMMIIIIIIITKSIETRNTNQAGMIFHMCRKNKTDNYVTSIIIMTTVTGTTRGRELSRIYKYL